MKQWSYPACVAASIPRSSIASWSQRGLRRTGIPLGAALTRQRCADASRTAAQAQRTIIEPERQRFTLWQVQRAVLFRFSIGFVVGKIRHEEAGRYEVGSSKVKTQPLPGRSRTLIDPPCGSAACLAMASPRPKPLRSVPA